MGLGTRNQHESKTISQPRKSTSPIDGVHIGEHCVIVALGIAADGGKHALGLWDG